MFERFLIMAAILLCLISPDAMSADCELHQVASLELKMSPGGSVLVPVVFQGTPAFMYLEIGSILTLVSQRAVDRFALHTSELPAKFLSFGGMPVKMNAAVSDIAIGEHHSSDNHFPVDPGSNSVNRYPTEDVVGILGMNLLWQMDIELDLAHKRLALYTPSQCAAGPVYWTDHYQVVPLRHSPVGEFYFPMEMDGRKIEAIFSIGNLVTTLTTDVTKRVYGFDKDSPGIESVTDKDGRETSQFRAMQMTSAGLKVLDEKVKLTNPPGGMCRLMKKADAVGYENCFGAYPLRLGRSVLEKMHIYIATEENRLYFSTE